jgi:hypothetical protein
MGLSLGSVLDAAGDALGTLAGGASAAGSVLVGAAEDTCDAVEDGVEYAEEKWEQATDQLEEWFEEAEEWFDENLGDAWETAMDQAGDIIDGLTDYAEECWRDVTRFLDGIVEAVADEIEQIWEKIAASVEYAWETLSSSLDAVWDAVTKVVEAAWDKLNGALDNAWDRLCTVGDEIADAAVRAYERALDALVSVAHFLWDLALELKDLIVALGACVAGQIILPLAKADCIIESLNRPYNLIPANTLDRLKQVYPNNDFSDVYYVENARLSANHYNPDTEAMTFGGIDLSWGLLNYVIFFRQSFDFSSVSFRSLVVHELVHVLQYRHFVKEPVFACAYGIGYAEAGFDYRANWMEDVAYDMEKNHENTIATM